MQVLIGGKPMPEMPADLFIPPDALEILLDEFCGPLDLLLYLIRRQNLDILDIPVAMITRQYIQYIRRMEITRMELASEYLLMAAMLADIKARMLLPQTAPVPGGESDEDPRMALVRKLQMYEQYKLAAENMDRLPRCFRDTFPLFVKTDNLPQMIQLPEVTLDCLYMALQSVLQRQEQEANYQISKEPLPVRERMRLILKHLLAAGNVSFEALLDKKEGRMGVIVTFLALLELARESLIVIFQNTQSSTIYIQTLVHEQQ